MATGFEDFEKVNALPKEGLHCFAANSNQIKVRRIVTIILMVLSVAAIIVAFCLKNKIIPLGIAAALVLIISALVFIQTFLIANYRVAIDYKAQQVVLRYRFSLITIPFESFDARDGEPDKAEELLDNTTRKEKVNYLVLDNVFDEACFQTSTKDLASREDFFQLRDETFAIADAYGARNSEDAIKPNQVKGNASDTLKKDLNDSDIDDIVDAALADDEEDKAEEKKD